MNKNNLYRGLKLALAAGAFATLAMGSISYSASQDKGICKAEITTSATNKSKSKAMSAAVEKWQGEVRKAHNTRLSRWDKAKRKNKHCTAVSGKWPNQVFTCVVTATPCP